MSNDQVCYICYESETQLHKYIQDPQPCNCRGSLAIHSDCLKNIINNAHYCSICKKKFNLCYLPTRCGLELITELGPSNEIIEYTIDESDKKHGDYIIKSKSGKILSLYKYNHGYLNGEMKSWYENGQLEYSCYCIGNNIEGEYSSWYEDGTKMEHSIYRDGLKNGISIVWSKRGKIVLYKNYVNGEEE